MNSQLGMKIKYRSTYDKPEFTIAQKSQEFYMQSTNETKEEI